MSDDTGITVSAEGEVYEIADLTWDECEELEDIYDCSFGNLDFGRLSVRRKIVWLFMRRKDPSVKLEDLGQIRILRDVLAEADAEPETVTPLVKVAN